MSQENPNCFIDPGGGIKLTQMPGRETTIRAGLRGEKMIMALNATLPGHTVLMHSHRHEQIGIVYESKRYDALVKRKKW